MIIDRKSNISGKYHTMVLDVTPEQIARWENGELVQKVFPNLSRVQREFLISGTTEDEWNHMLGIAQI